MSWVCSECKQENQEYLSKCTCGAERPNINGSDGKDIPKISAKKFANRVVLGFVGLSLIEIFVHLRYGSGGAPMQATWIDYFLKKFIAASFFWAIIFFLVYGFKKLFRKKDK